MPISLTFLHPHFDDVRPQCTSTPRNLTFLPSRNAKVPPASLSVQYRLSCHGRQHRHLRARPCKTAAWLLEGASPVEWLSAPPLCGALVEETLGKVAKELVSAGVRRLVVAGGETAGAVVSALGVEGLHIGREIDPGVPWTYSIGEPILALALKSGNFGTPDFFVKAFETGGDN